MNEKILEGFYGIYFRSPKYHEFRECGGAGIKKGEYNKWLTKLGYPVSHKNETVEVVNIRTNEVEYTGTVHDIVEEYDGTPGGVRGTLYKGNRFRLYYKLRYKPFDVDLVKKELGTL